MLASILSLSEQELDRQPVLLGKPRNISAALIAGAVERSDIYKVAGEYIEQLIGNQLNQAEVFVRDLRSKDIGEEDALEELKKGSKTEEEYIREAEKRKATRMKVRDEEKERRRLKEEEVKRKAEEERRRKREEEEARQG